jgi:hypothetical protein
MPPPTPKVELPLNVRPITAGDRRSIQIIHSAYRKYINKAARRFIAFLIHTPPEGSAVKDLRERIPVHRLT